MATVTTEKQKVTPPELAKRWGVAPEKIIFFILSGELRAIDASLLRDRGRKPRYLIDERDIEAFERGREVTPPLPKPVRRSRRGADINAGKFY